MINKTTQIIVDQGNTTSKFGFFQDRKLLHFIRVNNANTNDVNDLLSEVSNVDLFISSVRERYDLSGFDLKDNIKVIPFDRKLRLPIQVHYDTPETLGADRIANAVAANNHFPHERCLVIDAGTCITYTLIENGALKGGAISPGLSMRYNALNHFTGKLPLLSPPSEKIQLIGLSTTSSIHSGVVNGIEAEINGMINNFCSENGEFNVIMTGGDGGYLGSRMKTTIFALPHLTIEGLNTIYAFNYREKIF